MILGFVCDRCDTTFILNRDQIEELIREGDHQILCHACREEFETIANHDPFPGADSHDLTINHFR